MIEVKLGDRYAKSIYDLAVERGEIEQVHRDFEMIEKVCASNKDFVLMLRSPLINADDKQTIMDKIFGKHFSPITKTLVEIIIRKRREQYLLDIAMRFSTLYDNTHNITRGVVTSATPLSATQRTAISNLVEETLKTSFILEEKVDESLIGGFSLRVGDLLFDGSVSATLRKLSQEFDKNPYIKLT